MARRILAGVASLALVMAAVVTGLPAASAAAGPLTIAPLGWNVVGLDSNDVNAGPNRFPIGARVCNTGSNPVTNAAATWNWGAGNTALGLAGGSTRSLGSIPAASCVEAHFLVDVPRNGDHYFTSRAFSITASGDAVASVSTASPREVYVEKLVSQNRNANRSIKVTASPGCLPGPAPATGQPNTGTVTVGSTCTFVLDGKTATNGYEQLDAFMALDPAIFRVLSVSSTYAVPSGFTTPGFYADACRWDPVPTSPTYNDCVGPDLIGSGKAGGDPITVSVTALVVAPGTQQVAGTIYDFSGSSFHYNSDYSNLASRLSVTAVAPNAPPAASPVSTSTPEDTSVGGTVAGAASDPNGDALTFSLVSGPAPGTGSASVTAAGGYTYTPPANWSGTATFTYQACDPFAACASSTVTVTVTPSNDPPTAGPTSATTPQDTAISGSVAALAGDIDGDTLAFALSAGPTHGTASVDALGGFTYTPAPGYVGADAFTYQACDPSTACATAVVTLTVTAVNHQPSASPVTVSGPEDTPLAGSFAAADADGDALAFAATSSPQHGSLTTGPGAAFAFTPEAGWSGTTSFTYTACDPLGACSASTVTLTVTPVNDPPTAAPLSVSGPEDEPITGSLSGLGADVDGDALTYSLQSAATHGTVAVSPSGGFTYTPAAGFNGADSFGYSVCDPSGLCAQATVSITVTPVNDPPTAAPDAMSTPYETALPGSVAGLGFDPDGDALGYSVVAGPAHGGLSLDPAGDWLYTPSAGYSGPDSFVYAVCDPEGACAQAVIALTVGAPGNQPPTASTESFTVRHDVLLSDSLAVLAADPDGDPLAYALQTAASHGTVSVDPAGGFTYQPDAGYTGTDVFAFSACDPGLLCASALVTVTVTNAAPTADPLALSGPQDSVLAGAVAAADADGDPLAYAVIAAPAHGSLTFGPGGSFSFQPDAGWSGATSFTYEACDPVGACGTAVVALEVLAAVDPPPVPVGALAAFAVCVQDVPYVQWTYTAPFTPVSSFALTAGDTLEYLDASGAVVGAATAAGPSGQGLWPGAAESGGVGTDWPGWVLAAGVWTQGADGFEGTRPVMTVRYTPAGGAAVTAQVAYPDASLACAGPAALSAGTGGAGTGGGATAPSVTPSTGQAATATQGAALAQTGASAMAPLAIGALLVLAGTALRTAGRRRPGAARVA